MHFSSSHIAIGVALATSARSAHALVARAAPTAQDWTALNKTVGGRLAIGTPWAKPCFSIYDGRQVSPDSSECKFVEDNYFNSHLPRADAFGGWSATQWETCMSTGDSCQLNWANSSDASAFQAPAQCKQGSVPTYYIDVKDKDDVIAGIKFARKTNVPLVVKNTGHDFQGRSSQQGALALWTHHIKKLEANPKFYAEGCSSKKTVSTVTVGAGNQFDDIYKFADANNLLLVGGSDQSVGGGGGWILGGGHSSLSPTLGMGVDRVVQYKVVTPDGKYLTANSCQNEDLFFALRGGGGGTFGVILEVTLLANPRASFRVANINWEVSDSNYAKVLKTYIDNAETFAKQGWGGYITPSIGNAIFITPKLDQKAADVAMKPLLDITADTGRQSNVTQTDTFLQWFQQYIQGTSGTQDTIGVPSAIGSRLIPQKNHATPRARAELLNATLAAYKLGSFHQVHVTTPFGFTGDTSGTSVTPAWRTALWQFVLVNPWAFDATLADKKAAYALTTQGTNIMRKITPGSGAYHNEADIHEPDHEFSFWGSNYARLLQIKKKYDPDQIFDCWHCVGSKGEKDPRFSCYI